MARKSRRRYYRKKGRWSSNIQEINHQTINAAAGDFSGTSTLATNPVQSTVGVSQVYTVKNFEVNFILEGTTTSGPNIEAVTCYIMYVPQGMNVGEDYHLQHPEYIMNYKFIGSPTIEYTPASGAPVTQEYQPYRMKTRMARKLQTGDSIILFIKGYNQGSATTFNISGLIRWWTRAN